MTWDESGLVAGLRALAERCDQAAARADERGDRDASTWWRARGSELARSACEVKRELDARDASRELGEVEG